MAKYGGKGFKPAAEAPEESENIVAGRNAVRELLKSGKSIDKLYVQRDSKDGLITVIVAEAAAKRIPITEVDRRVLDGFAAANQGVVAFVPEREYASVEDILQAAADKGEAPFIVIADCINDPHNLGAIIRIAECAGAHGVIIPKRRSATLTATAVKASAGAAEHLPVAKVSNLSSAIELLKKNGVWVYALEADGAPYKSFKYDGGIAFVLGSEGEGVSRLVRENCDFVVSIPMKGKINSLNVSAAAAVVLFEASDFRSRTLSK
ncbi:MAG: 23S rRNA (guanosine(2251)-2'-O)-methyltransferase RlmB [Clostridia bacterium]|nr:23S rRNA (guanosine(2251)-2'-O)-methyltransferase RlmB [Clostridia bacterium]